MVKYCVEDVDENYVNCVDCWNIVNIVVNCYCNRCGDWFW